ncbi:hypothetical protein [Aquimarina sp. AU474]|uniref:hypothetical protein n=1 Tax=Aquimarina sp. AU474 TaxID=2108529 RepID=UPI000D691298|nr:hypothetical protein [Aquimarina sp. AU474]
MTEIKKKPKTSVVLCAIGSALLLIMALFHGSGFVYVSEAIKNSNAEEFLKEIVPVLFAHPSIHLISLTTFGILTIFLNYDYKKVSITLSSIIIIDAVLAFYLGGIIPGILLTIAATCFILVSLDLIKKKENVSKKDFPFPN